MIFLAVLRFKNSVSYISQTAILVTAGMNYIGASGDINVWNPKVDLPNDFTASQIWLKNGPSEKFDSVEAGWVVRAF